MADKPLPSVVTFKDTDFSKVKAMTPEVQACIWAVLKKQQDRMSPADLKTVLGAFGMTPNKELQQAQYVNLVNAVRKVLKGEAKSTQSWGEAVKKYLTKSNMKKAVLKYDKTQKKMERKESRRSSKRSSRKGKASKPESSVQHPTAPSIQEDDDTSTITSGEPSVSLVSTPINPVGISDNASNDDVQQKECSSVQNSTPMTPTTAEEMIPEPKEMTEIKQQSPTKRVTPQVQLKLDRMKSDLERSQPPKGPSRRVGSIRGKQLDTYTLNAAKEEPVVRPIIEIPRGLEIVYEAKPADDADSSDDEDAESEVAVPAQPHSAVKPSSTHVDIDWDLYYGVGGEDGSTVKYKKLKDVFEQRRLKLEKEATVMVTKMQKTRSKEHVFVDPPGLPVTQNDGGDGDGNVYYILPLSVYRVAFDAMRNATRDFEAKASKLGNSAVAVTVARATFDPLLKCLQAFYGATTIQAMQNAINKKNKAISADLLLDTFDGIVAFAEEIDQGLVHAAKGDHHAVAETADFIPSWAAEIDVLLSAAAKVLTSIDQSAANVEAVQRMVNATLQENGCITPQLFAYVAKHADLINHPQEARQFISAVRYVLPYADYKILIPKLSQQLKETWSVLEKYGITRT